MPRLSLTVLALSLLLAPPARAELLTPGSIYPTPVVTSPASQGTTVPAGGMAADAYRALGVVFSQTALAEVHGATAFVPVDTPFPFGSKLGQLNFQNGFNGVVQGDFVLPGTDTPAVTDWLSIEFVGVSSVGEGAGAFAARSAAFGDPNGTLLGNPYDGVAGADGHVIVTLHAEGIRGFDAYRLLALDDPWAPAWGVVSIEFGDLRPVENAPEPGTLLLATVGAAGAVALWRRRTARSVPDQRSTRR